MSIYRLDNLFKRYINKNTFLIRNFFLLNKKILSNFCIREKILNNKKNEIFDRRTGFGCGLLGCKPN